MTALLALGGAALAAWVWHLWLQLQGVQQRIDQWRDFTWRLERRIEALEGEDHDQKRG